MTGKRRLCNLLNELFILIGTIYGGMLVVVGLIKLFGG